MTPLKFLCCKGFRDRGVSLIRPSVSDSRPCVSLVRPSVSDSRPQTIVRRFICQTIGFRIEGVDIAPAFQIADLKQLFGVSVVRPSSFKSRSRVLPQRFSCQTSNNCSAFRLSDRGISGLVSLNLVISPTAILFVLFWMLEYHFIWSYRKPLDKTDILII